MPTSMCWSGLYGPGCGPRFERVQSHQPAQGAGGDVPPQEGTPIDTSEQVFYDITDLPVAFNTHYFNPEYYRLRTLQNWDLGI